MTYTPVNFLRVKAWGQDVGVVAPAARGVCAFEYVPEWRKRGIELAPLLMPTRAGARPFTFRDQGESFHGLPPMLADASPDRFGNALINAILAREGVSPSQVSALDRLAYVGHRAMGALTFEPDNSPTDLPTAVEMATLVETARAAVAGNLADDDTRTSALAELVAVGTSAGGARAKAVIAWDRTTGQMRAGNLPAPRGFEQWLVKFDGVGQDTGLGASEGYGRIEYAYYLMAKAAGIEMAHSELLEEGGRAHFATRRFDRPGDAGDRLHMQSLTGLAGLDYDLIGHHDYASLFVTARDIGAGGVDQLFRRMVFNVLASNCDDHPKNFAFLMDREGQWSLAPAYDVTFAYASNSRWTYQHLMGVGGKYANITVDDLLAAGEPFGVEAPRDVIAQVGEAVTRWETFAEQAGVSEQNTLMVRERLDLVWSETQMQARFRPATAKRGPLVARYMPAGDEDVR